MKVGLRSGEDVLDQSIGERDRIATMGRWEPPRHQTDEEDGREFQSFGLMNGEDVHRILVPIRLTHGRVVTSVDEGIEVIDEPWDAVVLGHAREALDDGEELGDVLHLERVLRILGVGERGDRPRALGEVMIEDLARLLL